MLRTCPHVYGTIRHHFGATNFSAAGKVLGRERTHAFHFEEAEVRRIQLLSGIALAASMMSAGARAVTIPQTAKAAGLSGHIGSPGPFAIFVPTCVAVKSGESR